MQVGMEGIRGLQAGAWVIRMVGKGGDCVCTWIWVGMVGRDVVMWHIEWMRVVPVPIPV